MLERLQVAVRLRGGWEALDLGACLLRRHGRAVYAVWVPLVGPVALALAVLFHRWPWASMLAFWWMKPAFDRLVLHVLGRAAFGMQASLRDTLRDLPALYRRGALAGLLWRRLSPQRSFVLPVWQLEGQDGRGFRQRVRPLLRRGRFTALSLTLACLAFTAILHLGVLLAIQLFVPQGSGFNVFQAAFGGEGEPSPGWLPGLLALLPFLAASAIEPFYVAAGFGLYLNRRVQLEGWDLELAFRKLAGRLARAALVLALLAAGPLVARPAAPARIEAVLQAPEFQTSRVERGLRWKSRPKAPAPEARTPRWLEAWARRLAGILKAGLVLAALVLAAGFLWRYRRVFGTGAAGPGEPETAATLFGLDLRPGSLPEDVAGAARSLFAAGRSREALALLYRASLARLVGGGGSPVPPGATEGDCLRIAAGVLDPAALDCFGRLTRAWQDAAYAGRPPEDGEALCRCWTAGFEGRP